MSRKTKRVLLTVLCDIAITGALLLAFAYFHHVKIDVVEPKAVSVSVQPENAVPSPAATAEPAATPVPEEGEPAQTEEGTSETAEEPEPSAVPSGLLQGKYSEKFTDDVRMEEGSYSSKDISIEITTMERFGSNVHVADVYLNDIKCLRSAVFSDYSKRYMSILEMARSSGAIVAISGDHFYAHRAAGVFAVRNGQEYFADPNTKQDICVLYNDGVMECYSAEQIDKEAIYARGAYQVWDFGPNMLDENGKALGKYASSVANVNPRSAIGYYEPGHYCLVNVEGRTKDSGGVTLVELGQIFEELGCKVAYNLDGGKTAVMTFGDKAWSHVLGGGRDASDIIYIKEVDTEGQAG